MLQFQATLHARSHDVSPGIMLNLRGAATTTLVVPPAALAYPFAVSFEESLAQLAKLDRMFIEPDGSFVWVSASEESASAGGAWQLDGNLFDRNGRLLMIDAKGSCGDSQLEWLLAAVGWPETAVMFQLTREAVFLDETSFRHYAGRQP